VRVRIAIGLLLGALLAGCGGGAPSPESVVRAWSAALNTGDDEAAAKLFAPRAEVIQGRSFVLESESEAIAFNAALPCSGEIVELEAEGEIVTASFRLGERPARHCDAPGALARATFRVREGKIVLWHQLPSSGAAPGETV
jgi:limonene-1,2-epoxide hydrolase